MNKVIFDQDKQRTPIKMWLDGYEDGGLEQAINVSNLPFIHKHVALMPDMHQGYGVPIGCVFATKDIIIPNAVGKDISCGVATLRLPIKDISLEELKKVFGGSSEYKGGIRTKIPVGINRHSKEQEYPLEFWPLHGEDTEYKIAAEEYSNSMKQIGTLGGGNHFIEVQKGSDGFIYITIHSGSRNIGYKVATHYDNIAKQLCKDWYAPEEILKADLAYLPVSSPEGVSYILEMEYCMKFAKANRRIMIEKCVDAFVESGLFDYEDITESIKDVNHNYAALEHHFGDNVWVHRKGAVRAREGDFGIIPGSQGSKSYIVRGLGNKDSFMSCSHGAGRNMSRNKSIQNLNLDTEINKLKEAGVLLHTIRGNKSLDEAPGAYKDINKVMELQKDLVEIVVELSPLGCIKG